MIEILIAFIENGSSVGNGCHVGAFCRLTPSKEIIIMFVSNMKYRNNSRKLFMRFWSGKNCSECEFCWESISRVDYRVKGYDCGKKYKQSCQKIEN